MAEFRRQKLPEEQASLLDRAGKTFREWKVQCSILRYLQQRSETYLNTANEIYQPIILALMMSIRVAMLQRFDLVHSGLYMTPLWYAACRMVVFSLDTDKNRSFQPWRQSLRILRLASRHVRPLNRPLFWQRDFQR